MVNDKSLQIRVGIFVTAGLALAMFILFSIGSQKSWFEDDYKLYCKFKDISGLSQGAVVSLAGVNIGTVVELKFPKDPKDKEIIVMLELVKEYQDRIRRDSFATITTQGLLGDKLISVTVGNPGEEILKDGEELKTKKSGDLFSLGQSASEVVGDLREVLESVGEMLNEAKNGKGVIHALFYDPAGESMIKDLSSSAKSIKGITAELDRNENVKKSLSNFSDASADIKEMTALIRRGEGTIGGLLTDEAIYNDIRVLFGRASRNVLLKSVVRSLLKENDKSIHRK